MNEITPLLQQFVEDRDSLSDEELERLVDAVREDSALALQLKQQLVLDELLAQQLSVDRGGFLAQVEQRIRDLESGADHQFYDEDYLRSQAELRCLREELGRRAPRPRRRRLRPAITALALLLLTGLVAWQLYAARFVGTAELLAGDVVIRRHNGTVERAGSSNRLFVGDWLETGPDSTMLVQYPDGTRLEVESETHLRFERTGGGLVTVGAKHVFIEQGQLSADVAPQPLEQPMRFSTPTAVARVLGTSLTLQVTAESTRLDVESGRVAIQRAEDAAPLIVESHETAFVTAEELSVSAARWPHSRDGLVFLFAAGDEPILQDPHSGEPVASGLRLRGRTEFDDLGALTFNGSSCEVEGAADLLLDACRRTNELTVEALIRPGDERKNPNLARIVTFSHRRQARNFALEQHKRRLKVHVQTSQSATDGRSVSIAVCELQPAEYQHVVVTYRPGRLVCYLNGRQVFKTTGVQGDFRDWQPYPLMLGGEWHGGRDWRGSLAAIAIYNRCLDSDEVRQAHRSLKRIKNRHRSPGE